MPRRPLHKTAVAVDDNDVYAYTDGSARTVNGRGAGAWGFLIAVKSETAGGCQLAQKHLMVSSVFTDVTSIQMELMAVLNAVRYLVSHHLNQKCLIRSDSEYVVKGIREWMHSWQKNSWKKSDGQTPAHLPEWKAIYQSFAAHGRLKIEHVSAHSGEMFNDLIDRAVQLKTAPFASKRSKRRFRFQ